MTSCFPPFFYCYWEIMWCLYSCFFLELFTAIGIVRFSQRYLDPGPTTCCLSYSQGTVPEMSFTSFFSMRTFLFHRPSLCLANNGYNGGTTAVALSSASPLSRGPRTRVQLHSWATNITSPHARRAPLLPVSPLSIIDNGQMPTLEMRRRSLRRQDRSRLFLTPVDAWPSPTSR